jgi:hypothetical protein
MSHGMTAHTTFDQMNASAQSLTDAEVCSRPPKRRFDGEFVTTQPTPPDSVVSTSAQLQRSMEGRSYILNELSNNSSLADNQRSMLEIAIAFMDQLSQTTAPSLTPANGIWSNKVPVELTQNELLQVLIASMFRSHYMLYRTADQTRPARGKYAIASTTTYARPPSAGSFRGNGSRPHGSYCRCHHHRHVPSQRTFQSSAEFICAYPPTPCNYLPATSKIQHASNLSS